MDGVAHPGRRTREETAMNLNAHPLTVAAELAWKQESLGGANAARRRGPRRRPTGGWHLPWRRRPGRGPVGPTPRAA